MPGFYPQIDIAGTPKEMGLAHGRQLRARVQQTAASLRSIVGSEIYDASWRDLQQTYAYCQQHAPALMEEIEGIAQGAEMDIRNVFMINAHLEVVSWKRMVWQAPVAVAHSAACSSHAVVTDAEVLLGWNGDDWKGWLDCGAIVRGHPAHGEPFIYFSWAGSVGRPGLGSHLALGANTLPGKHWRADGLLYNMLCRQVLEARSAEEGVEIFKTNHACSGMNYLIADEAGTLVDVEAHADGFEVLTPEDRGTRGYLLHTNCFLNPQLAGGEVDVDTTCSRLSAAQRLYREKVPVDVAGVRAVQSDHTGGVCVHREESCTVISFVAEVRSGQFHAIRGNPCEGTAQTFTLN
ncbi:MAG: hypothetical protein EXR62_15095 [Chloroflexi bacterium]|nr:hypothetical protein [Chloroflexota bacterium]